MDTTKTNSVKTVKRVQRALEKRDTKKTDRDYRKPTYCDYHPYFLRPFNSHTDNTDWY